MIVTLKKNEKIDGIAYFKHDEFHLISIHWSDTSTETYIVRSKSGETHTASANLFTF